MTSDVQQTILEKVKALLAKAASTHSEEEAENCTRLAHKLLEKHNLSISQLPADQQEAAGKDELQAMYVEPWRTTVIQAVVRLYYCSYYHSEWFDQAAWDKRLVKHRLEMEEYEASPPLRPGHGDWPRQKRYPKKPDMRTYWRPSFHIIGRPGNRAVAAEMTKYIWDTVVRLATDYARTLDEHELRGTTRRAAMLGFTRGCGDRVAPRIFMLAYAARKAEEDAKRKQGSSGTAVALYDQFDKENEDFKKDLGLRKRKSGTIDTDGDHAEAGAAAGANISLAPQIGSKPSKVKTVGAPPKLLGTK